MKKDIRVLLKNPDGYEEMSKEEQDKIKRILCTLSSEKLKEILDSIPVNKGNVLFTVVVRFYAESLTNNDFQINKIIENITYERAIKFLALQKFNAYSNITMNNEFKRVRKIGDKDGKH